MDGMTHSSMAAMPSSTSSAMGSMSSSSDMMMMPMVFFTSTTTPLFSNAWTPTSTGQYAGTCIFLILLSIILRCLYAFKAHQERRWLREALQRRYIVTAAATSSALPSNFDSDLDEETKSTAASGVLTTNGVREDVRIVERLGGIGMIQPWRLSVDLPRAILVTVMVGLGYLLMLAVMTYNVGYFLSVLAGAFVGELFLGRFATHVEEHH